MISNHKQEAISIIAELMQGYHSAERMIDILHLHLLIQYDKAFKAGYTACWENHGAQRQKDKKAKG